MQKIKIEGEWRNIVAVYKKVNNQWVQQDEYDFDNIPHFYSDAMVDVDTLLIIAQSAYSGMQFYVIAKLNNTQVNPTWSITSGNQYATINQSGQISILTGAENSLITVKADWKCGGTLQQPGGQSCVVHHIRKPVCYHQSVW